MIFSNYLSYFANTTKRIISFSYYPLSLLKGAIEDGFFGKLVAGLTAISAIAKTLLFYLPVGIVALAVHTLAMALIFPFVVTASFIELGVNIVRPLPKPLKWGDCPIIDSSYSICKPDSRPRLSAPEQIKEQTTQRKSFFGFFGSRSKKASPPSKDWNNDLERPRFSP